MSEIQAPRFMSQTAEHAVRALLHLALHTPGPVKAGDIAANLGAPSNYMSKTLHTLAGAGIVSSRRGPTGGFRLAVDPAELTLGQIIEVVDDPAPKYACLVSNEPCSSRTPCHLHARWKAVSDQVWEPLRSTTLADLLDSTQ